MSNTTKRVLAMSMKKLLGSRTLENITIQDLVDDAEVSRKTFYYHFRDVYDLLEWILVDEGRRLIAALAEKLAETDGERDGEAAGRLRRKAERLAERKEKTAKAKQQGSQKRPAKYRKK